MPTRVGSCSDLLLRWVASNGQPLSSGETPADLVIRGRLPVLLPERSAGCNQPACAFGGLLQRRLSPDGANCIAGIPACL